MFIGLNTGLTRRSGKRGFRPSDLFGGSDDGGWYDPSDLTSMYVGRLTDIGNRTTTVASVGSVVGTVIDRSKLDGKTVGDWLSSTPELISNGTFDTDLTGWTVDDAGGTVAVSSGRAALTGIGGTVYISQAISTVAGETYLISADCVSGGNIHVAIGSTAINSQDIAYTAVNGGTTMFYLFKAVGATTYVSFREFAATGPTLIDNVSVKALPGNHLVAPSDAARPLLQTEGGRYYLDFDGTDDAFLTEFTTASATSSLCVAFNPETDTTYIIHSSLSTSFWTLIGQDGSTNTNVLGTGGSLRKNGASYTPADRNVFRDDMVSSSNVLTVESLDTTGWSNDFGISNLPTYYLDGRWYGTVFINRALTAAERDSLEQFLATKSGATLA